MSRGTFDPNRLIMEGPHSVLERTLVAEYLLIRGYLMSDLENLPLEIAKSLLREACQHADITMAMIESGDKFKWEIRLPFSLN